MALAIPAVLTNTFHSNLFLFEAPFSVYRHTQPTIPQSTLNIYVYYWQKNFHLLIDKIYVCFNSIIVSNSEKKSLFIETYLEVVDSLHQGERGSHQQVGNLEQGGSLQEQGDILHQEQEGSLHREQEDNQDQGGIHQLEDILDIPDKI